MWRLSMFLSKLTLNKNNISVLKDLKDCYLMHQRLLLAFSEKYVSPDFDYFEKVKEFKDGQFSLPYNTRSFYEVLHRIENNDYILVQSRVKPHWNALSKDYLINNENGGCQIHDLNDLQENLKEDLSVRFRLKAHPTFFIKSENSKTHRRQLYKSEEVHQWIFNKAKRFGFKIEHISINRQPNIKGNKSNNQLNLFAFIFEGILTIINLEDFWEGLRKGIGTAKSFGFGLLSIAPIY